MPVGAPRPRPRPRLKVGAQGVLSAVAKQSANMARLKRSLWQSKPDRKPVWKLPVCSLVVWEPSLGPRTQGPFLQQNDLPASASQPGMTLSPQATGDAIILGGRKGRPTEWVFRPLVQPLCGSSDTRPQGLLPGTQFLSQGQVSACTLQALQAHS